MWIERLFRKPLRAAALFAVLGFAAKWLSSEFSGRDWAYFNSLSWLVRSTVWHYRRLPLHDPWCGGGLYLLANPQNRLFSPSVLFDLLLPPYWANLASLTVLAFFGIWGMAVFLKELEVPSPARWVAAVVFINGSWFALHFAEGHIPFGSMMLLPWVLVCVRGMERPGRLPLLGALFAFFLLDGGIYSLIFSLFAVMTLVATGLQSVSGILAAIRRKPLLSALTFAGFVLASLPKLYPVLTEISSRKPNLDVFVVPPLFVLKMLFWPLQRLSTRVFGHEEWGIHEFGCYLGIATTVWIARWLSQDRDALRENRRLLIACGFWLWIATGWFDPVNPWRLFQKIPLLNNAHVQSRAILILYLFFMIVAARSFAKLDLSKRRAALFMSFILLESVAVRNYAFLADFRWNKSWPTYGWIQSTTVARSVAKMDKPDLYLATNTAVVHCYEPSMPPPPAIPAGEPGYRGESYVEAPGGQARIESFIPGKLVVEVDSPAPSRVVINTRDIGHWKKISPSGNEVSILSAKNDRLTFAVPSGHSTIRAEVEPSSLLWLVLSWLLGVTLLIGLLAGRSSKAAPR